MKKTLIASAILSVFLAGNALAAFNTPDTTPGYKNNPFNHEDYDREHNPYYALKMMGNDLRIVTQYPSEAGAREIQIKDFGITYPEVAKQITLHNAQAKATIDSGNYDDEQIDKIAHSRLTWNGRVFLGDPKDYTLGTFSFDLTSFGINDEITSIDMPAMPSGSNAVLHVKKINGKTVYILDHDNFDFKGTSKINRVSFARDIQRYYKDHDITDPLPEAVQKEINRLDSTENTLAAGAPSSEENSPKHQTDTNLTHDTSVASSTPVINKPNPEKSEVDSSQPNHEAHAEASTNQSLSQKTEVQPKAPADESTNLPQTPKKAESEKTVDLTANKEQSKESQPSDQEAEPVPPKSEEPPAASPENQVQPELSEKPVSDTQPPVAKTEDKASETTVPPTGKEAAGSEPNSEPENTSTQGEPNNAASKPTPAVAQPADSATTSTAAPAPAPTEKKDPSPEANKDTPKESAAKPEETDNKTDETPTASTKPNSAAETKPAPEVNPVPETKPTEKTEPTTAPEAKADKETATGSGTSDGHKESTAATAGETTPVSTGSDTHSTESEPATGTATETHDSPADSSNAGHEETTPPTNAEEESNHQDVGNHDNHEMANPLTPEQKSVFGLTSQAVGLWSAEMNDVSKRLGDLHFVHGEHGAWVRVYGGQYKSHFTLADEVFNARTDFSALQVGADTVLHNQTRVGLALSTMAVKSKDTDNKANLLGLTAYATFEPTENDYVDLVAKLAHVNNKFAVGKIKQWGYSASAEVGHRFELLKGLTLTPNAELTIGQLKGKSGTIDNDTFTLGNVNNTTGRIGADLGYQYQTGSVALKASVVRDFGNKINFKVNDQQADINLGGTHVVLGLKGTQTLGQNWNVYYNLEKSFRGNMKLTWRGDLGVRYNF